MPHFSRLIHNLLRRQELATRLQRITLRPFPHARQLLSNRLYRNIHRRINVPITPHPRVPRRRIIRVLTTISTHILRRRINRFILERVSMIRITPSSIYRRYRSTQRIRHLQTHTSMLLPLVAQTLGSINSRPHRIIRDSRPSPTTLQRPRNRTRRSLQHRQARQMLRRHIKMSSHPQRTKLPCGLSHQSVLLLRNINRMRSVNIRKHGDVNRHHHRPKAKTHARRRIHHNTHFVRRLRITLKRQYRRDLNRLIITNNSR